MGFIFKSRRRRDLAEATPPRCRGGARPSLRVGERLGASHVERPTNAAQSILEPIRLAVAKHVK